jgi:hypothetical protein
MLLHATMLAFRAREHYPLLALEVTDWNRVSLERVTSSPAAREAADSAVYHRLTLMDTLLGRARDQ